MRRRKKVNRTMLGVIGLVVTAIFVAFVFTKKIPFVHDYRVKANFASSNQLVAGFSPVRIAGVTVGKVTKIGKGPGGSTQVEMQVKDTALPLHSDASVRIRPRLFLEGGFYVELRPGSPSAPELEENSTLDIRQTDGPVQLHQILETFDQDTLADLRTVLEEFDTGLDNGGAQAFGRAIEAFGPVLRDTAQITEAGRGSNPHDVSEGIAATSEITQVLAERQDALRGLVTNLNRTTTAFASRDSEVSRTIVEIDGIVRDAPRALDAVDALQPSLRRFVTALRPALRIAPPVLADTTDSLRQLRLASAPAEIPALLNALGPTVRGLPRLENRLNTLFGLITPVMDCLRNNAEPVLAGKIPDGALSTGLPVYQELAQAAVGVVSFEQNFDGNGFSSRYLNGAGEQAFATGAVPGLGQLVGTLSEPISGSRPTYLGPGILPPFRPDAPCADQAPVDLSQRTGGGPPSATRGATAKPVTKAQRAEARKVFEELNSR